MLSYPVRTALDSGLFDHVLVSTEDREIAALAQEAGAEVIRRPVQLAEDRSTVVEVCLHALEVIPKVETLCCLYATAVLLKKTTLCDSRRLLDETPPANFVMGVSEYDQPPVQALTADSNGFLSYMWPEWEQVQSQSYPYLVVSNGTFYWARARALQEHRTFYGVGLKGFVVPRNEVSDINTRTDLRQAQRLLKRQRHADRNQN